MILKLMLDADTATALQAAATCNDRAVELEAIALIRRALGMTETPTPATT